MSHRRLLFYTAAGSLAAACASSPPVTSTSTPEPTPRQASAPSTGAWTGTFQATQERTGAVAPTRRQNTTGTVRLRQSVADPQRTAVSLTVSTPIPGATSLQWAVLPGRCGAGALPVLGFDQFPTLDVSPSGRAQLDVEIPLALPQSGQYHVNVYSGGNQLDHVITCATLRRGG